MKKFLSIFSCVVVSGSAAISTTSCANGFDHKTSGGSTIDYHLPITNKDFSADNLWKYLNLNNDPQFQQVIDNNWRVDSIPGAIKQKISQYVYKIFNGALLAGLADPKGIEIPGSFSNVAGFGDLKQIFALMWSDLTAEVNAQVKHQKKTQGKNWTKWLKDNYDGSESEYRAHLFVFGGDGVISASDFINNFMFNYQTDFGTISSPQVIALFNQVISAIKDNKTSSITNYQWAQLAISQYQLSTKALLNNFATIESFKNYLTNYLSTHSDVTNYSGLVPTPTPANPSFFDVTGKSIYQIDSSKTISATDQVKTLIYDNYNSDLSNNNELGLFSPFQLFIERNWFKTQKPLAVSQILFKYSSDGGKNAFDITKKNFTDELYNRLEKLFSTKTYNNLESIMKDLKNATQTSSSKTWDQEFSSISTTYGTDSNIVATKSKDFLTPNGTEDANSGFNSDIQKLAIYGNLNKISATNNKNLIGYDAQGIWNKTFGKPKEDSLTAIYRQNENTMAGVFKINYGNVVVYFDKLGLHIVHVDGSSSSSTNNHLKKVQPSSETTLTNYKITNSTDDSNSVYGNINKYNKQTDINNPNASGLVNNFDSDSTYLNFLNKHQFLAQSKDFKAKNTQELNYDIQSDLQSYAKLDTSSPSVSNTAPFWFYSFAFAKYLLDNNNTNPNWLTKILDFSDSSNAAKKIENIFLNIINNYQQFNNAISLRSLTKSFNAIKTSIDTNYEGPQGNFVLNDILNMITKPENDFWGVSE